MDSTIAAVHKGNVGTMMELFRKTAPRVQYVCQTLLDRERDISDAAASSFRWGFEQTLAGRIETAEEFGALVLRRALTECRMRAVGRDRKLFRFPAGYSFVRPFKAEDLVRGEDRVDTVLKTFPPMHRFVCVGRAITGASPEQVANALELGQKTVSMTLAAEEENIRGVSRIMGENFTPRDFQEQLLAKADGTAVPQELTTRVQGDADRLAAPIKKAASRKTMGIVAVAAVIVVILAMIIIPIATRSSGSQTDDTSSASGSSDTSGSSASSSSSGSASDGSSSAADSSSASSSSASTATTTGVTLEDAEYTADIEIQDYGTVKVALDHDIAPETVDNFVKLAKDGFYDGLTFHRIMEGFMMQGGDPSGDGTGGSEETIPGEFSSNGFDNPLSHVRGTISMARSNDPDSASSQFFIVQEDSTFLDGNYAGFGSVLEGMDVVDAICEAAQPTDDNGTIPAEEQPVITSITINEV